jgi:diguanylate cyclase (GGDEF)-like protein
MRENRKWGNPPEGREMTYSSTARNNKKKKLFDMTNDLSSIDKNTMTKSQNIWRSRISWKIALSVFATIVIVQAAIMVFTLSDVENEKLRQIRDMGLSGLAPVLEQKNDQLTSPIPRQKAAQVFSTTPLRGISIYSMDLSQITSYGEPTILRLKNSFNLGETYRSADRMYYEVIYTSADLRNPYFIVAKLDASSVRADVMLYIQQNVLILLLLSAFVTSVLMLALSQWLLEPILLLRRNLVNAVSDPENPSVQDLDNPARDEVSVTIHIANDLIRQNATNIIKLKEQAEDRIHQLAYYDTLTELPNRALFAEKLESAIKHDVMAKDKSLVVMSVDLDHFKDINDSMGHEIGDMLLEAVAERLVNATPDRAVIARASADEFVIMVPLEKDISESSEIINNIFASLREPMSIMQEQFQIRASVGIAHCPQDGMDAGHVMKSADIALNRAKEDGRDTYRFYSEDFDRAVQARFQMLRDLRKALDEDQLTLHYHPQFDLRNGKMIGAEALLRWWRPNNSKEGGHFISPVEFIPISEQSGLIVPIGEWVLRTACQMAMNWQKDGYPPFRIAVNISGVQFHRGDIVNTVKQVLDETGLDAKMLELEVTESIFMDDIEFTIGVLRELHDLGCELAIDDFGTGYSSLSYLRQFPIDRLKIDQSFIRDALVNSDDQAITRTIISLGHSLGLKVIAEGVETLEHQEFLIQEECDEAQGFRYTKPLPAQKLREFSEGYKGDLEAPEMI